MPPDPKIMARAVSGEPPPEQPKSDFALACQRIAQLAGLVANFGRRLMAVEARPIAQQGPAGQDGLSISGVRIDDHGHLRVTVGFVENDLGNVRGQRGPGGPAGPPGIGQPGPPGKDGVGILGVARADRRLIISLADGRDVDLGEIVGEPGPAGESIQGPPGEPGQSIQGQRGDNGPAGVGVRRGVVDDSGCLILHLTDGSEVIAGMVMGREGPPGRDAPIIPGPQGDPGRDGRDGRGIAGAVIAEDGRLCLSLTDGSDLVLTNVVGRAGAEGNQGSPGTGIAEFSVNSAGELVVLLTDGSLSNLGRIVGDRGPAGLQGVKGDLGEKGPKGDQAERGAPGERGPIGPRGEIGPAGRDGISGTPIELGDARSAGLTARDISKIREREVVIDGQLLRVLVLE